MRDTMKTIRRAHKRKGRFVRAHKMRTKKRAFNDNLIYKGPRARQWGERHADTFEGATYLDKIEQTKRQLALLDERRGPQWNQNKIQEQKERARKDLETYETILRETPNMLPSTAIDTVSNKGFNAKMSELDKERKGNRGYMIKDDSKVPVSRNK